MHKLDALLVRLAALPLKLAVNKEVTAHTDVLAGRRPDRNTET